MDVNTPFFMPTSEVVYSGALRTTCRHIQSAYEIQTDAPTDNHGKGERFSPTDLVATALGSCALTIMGIKSRDMKIDIEGMTVAVTKTMAAEPRRIGKVEVVFTPPSDKEYDDRTKSILEKVAFSCPVAQSLSKDLEQIFVFNW